MCANRYALVTTCRNEADSISGWIADISYQTRQPDEISIVDAFSTDGTWQILLDWAKSNARVRLMQEKCPPARGRNLAIQNTASNIIVSTDMGCHLPTNWFEVICKPFEDKPDIGAVGGNSDIDQDTLRSPVAWAGYYLIKDGFFQTEPGFLPSNRSIAYRKDIWTKLGGLPEDLSFAADDNVFSTLLLHTTKVYYALDAIVYWGRHNSWQDYLIESYRYGLGSGEAGFITDIESNISDTKYLKIKATIYAMSCLRLYLLEQMYRAIRDKKYLPSLLIVPLCLARSYNYYLGLSYGFQKGRTTCCKTRDLLSKSSVVQV